MQPANLFRSTGFRLVAWYAVVFGVSVAILLTVVYWIAVAALEQQLEDSVVRETRLLADVYKTRGLEALERGIHRRSTEPMSPRRFYVLQDAAGARIAGNLPPMAPKDPCGSAGSSFHCSSSQRYPLAIRFGATFDGWSVVDVIPSGLRTLSVT